MARTYTYGDAQAFVGQAVSKKIEDNYATYLCNIATNYLWNKADWRESIEELPPFYLRVKEQDHGRPTYTLPSDFKGLRRPISIVQIGEGGIEYSYDIEIQKDLPLTHVEGMPSKIGFAPETEALRIYPRVPENVGLNYMVMGRYKKRPVKVTSDVIHTTYLPWDDSYFHVYNAVLLWAYYSTINHPKTQEQLNYANYLISDMIAQEGLDSGDPVISPDMPLVEFPGV